jgi:hypothetical protein
VPFFDRNLNMYRASTGGYFATREAAAAAESGASAAPAAATAPLRNFAPDVGDASGRVNTGGATRGQDFFGEGAWNDPLANKPITAADPNDQPNPRNPDSLSNNDLAEQRAYVTAKARATTNSNLGAGGGIGSTTDAGFATRQAPTLTSGRIDGAGFKDSHGRSYEVYRQTPEETARYNALLGNVEDLGWGGGESTGKAAAKVGTGAASGAATGAAVAGPVGGIFGAVIGAGGGALALDGSNSRQLGLTANSGGFDASGRPVDGGQYNADGTSTDSPAARAAAAAAAGGGAPGTGTTAQGLSEASAETDQAKDDYSTENAENAAENSSLWSHANELAEGVGHDNALGDEARGYQREGLQQQRMLLDRMLGFDPNQYATQFSDQALSRQIALARSSGGGAAAQQAGIFAAMDQAPALYAEGARQASSLENQRLAQAETAAKSFGELGTMTRGQDEARSAFESSLSLDIAKQVGALTQGQVNMNEADSQRFAEIWMDFAKLQSVYAGMSSAEQLAWWQKTTAERGQDKQFEAIVASLKAGGKVSEKDLVGGLFQLGGGVISSYGQIQAANAKAA